MSFVDDVASAMPVTSSLEKECQKISGGCARNTYQSTLQTMVVSHVRILEDTVLVSKATV